MSRMRDRDRGGLAMSSGPGRTRREALRAALGAAAVLALAGLAPALRRHGIDPERVARRFGLRRIPLREGDLRGPHDLAG